MEARYTMKFTENMNNKDGLKEKHAQYMPKETMTLEGYPVIEGYDFEQGLDFQSFLQAYSKMGFQGTNLAQAMEVVRVMLREKAMIFLAYTSNMVSSGNREIIKYLVKNKKVQVLVTSAGGIEEDIIKCLKPFVLGQFEASGRMLFEHGINRIGNVFVPNDRFAYFDQFMQEFLLAMYDRQKKEGKIFTPHELIREIGLKINDEKSILYWAAKNDIPVFCPGLIDGSFGDMIFFFKQSHPDFYVDVAGEIKAIVDLTLNVDKTGGIILGGGISKHFALNANIFREGFDYVVYINTAQEFDGSDSGARVEEAISWGKVRPDALHVKVYCDATIAFPLLVAGAMVEVKNSARSEGLKMSYVNVYTSDVTRLVAFYRDVVGLVACEKNTSNWFGFETGETTFAIEPQKNREVYTFTYNKNNPVLVQLRVNSVEELGRITEKLEAKGVVIGQRMMKKSYGVITTFVDPDQNVVELLVEK